MENRVPAIRLGSELLMNIQVSARRQKRKAPQLWSVHSARFGQRGDQHPPRPATERPGRVMGLFRSCELV